MGLMAAFFGWMILNPYFRFPDGYAIDFDRDPPRFAAPCDRNNIVSFNLPTERLIPGGGAVAVRFDGEDRYMGHGADSVMVRLRWRF
jgi:hypothetical protein